MCGLIVAKELKCANGYSHTCVLENKESIPPNTQNMSYFLSGINDDQKNDIIHLRFDTKNVAFIPKFVKTLDDNIEKISSILGNELNKIADRLSKIEENLNVSNSVTSNFANQIKECFQ